jgi:hypothetical protein
MKDAFPLAVCLREDAMESMEMLGIIDELR